MNIGELKEKIKDLPDSMDIYIGERLSEYDYGLVNTAKVVDVYLPESESKVEALILSED